MKKQIFTMVTAAAFVAATGFGQVQTASVSMGNAYVKDVYFNLEDLSKESFDKSNWDIAFYRANNYDMGIRVNHEKGWELYEATDDVNEWSNINIANIGDWEILYNSNEDWLIGAFDLGSASYGWGNYNPANHHVTAGAIFILKDGDNFKKIKIDDFFGAYTFTYSNWDDNNQTWESDITKIVSNTENPGKVFNYYSFDTQDLVVAEAEKWDLKFTQYKADLQVMWMTVTGVLHHPSVAVAKNDETSGTPDLDTLTYHEEINTIGYDWKSYDMGSGTYTVDNNTGYYIKTTNDAVYRVIFTAFSSANGDIEFTVEKLLEGTAGIEDNNPALNFAIYPNPAVNSVDVIVNGQNGSIINIMNLNGAVVLTDNIESGVFSKTLDISNLNQGVYLVQINSGTKTSVKKLVITK